MDDEGFIDYDEVERKAKESKPKLIVAGASAYARTIDFKRFREIAHGVGAYLMVDMAHIAGLVAAGEHPSPIPYADVVTTTTHKTLRGPRGGMILANREAAEKFNFNKAIFPGTQGGPLEHVIAAKAVCLGEALKPEFKEYAHQVVLNAQALASALKKQSFKLLTGGTDNHLLLLDLRGQEITGKELEHRLDEVYITVNKNTVPNEPRSPLCDQRCQNRYSRGDYQGPEGGGHGSDRRIYFPGDSGLRGQCGQGARGRKRIVRKVSLILS